MPKRPSPTVRRLGRRRFLGQAGCALLGSQSILSTLLHLRLANNAAAQAIDPLGTDRRTLVCVFLHGGIDSFNFLIPTDSRYAEYAATRSNLALSSGMLHPLHQAGGGDGGTYGLHPSTPELAELFNGFNGDPNARRLAFIANIGTLVRPTTLADYLNGTGELPRALFSHSDQSEQWQTSVPQGQADATGWAGRAADVLHSTVNSGSISMSISIDGNNVFQVGRDEQQFVATPEGGLTFSSIGDWAPANHPINRKNAGLESLMGAHYENLMEQAYANIVRNSAEAQEQFQGVFDAIDPTVINSYLPDGEDWFQAQLRAAARVILAREPLGLRRQTVFVSFGGWDHHDELLDTQAPMLTVLSRGLSGFQRALEALGLSDSVVTFTASDFGRTLRSNGRGTDHAWGGNQLVMGGPVRGGRIYGSFPSLALDGPNDVGQGGRMLPTTAVDELFGDLLYWFGVSAGDYDYVLPNARNFFDPAAGSPLGLFA